MTDPPPPTGPPPGWYPDPGTGQGLRWWDGSSWTEQTSAAPQPGPGLAAPGEWLREAVRLTVARAGHLFPLVVVLLVPISLANGLAIWAAFREAVMTTDTDAGTISFDNPSGSAGLYVAIVVTGILQAAATLVLVAASARQADAALEDRPEPWSASLLGALARLPRILGVGLALVGVLVGLYLLMALSTVAPLLLLVTFPLWVVGSFLVWVRLALAPVGAALAPSGVSALRTSWDLTRSRFWALLGRLLLVVLVAVMLNIMTSLLSTPFVALGGGGSTVEFQAGDERIPLGEFLGDNPAVFAIGQLFSALGYGAVAVLFAVGMTLIYRRLQGPTAVVASVVDPADGGTANGGDSTASGDSAPSQPGTGTSHGF